VCHAAVCGLQFHTKDASSKTKWFDTLFHAINNATDNNDLALAECVMSDQVNGFPVRCYGWGFDCESRFCHPVDHGRCSLRCCASSAVHVRCKRVYSAPFVRGGAVCALPGDVWPTHPNTRETSRRRVLVQARGNIAAVNSLLPEMRTKVSGDHQKIHGGGGKGRA
jgi:hypothetical protein